MPAKEDTQGIKPPDQNNNGPKPWQKLRKVSQKNKENVL